MKRFLFFILMTMILAFNTDSDIKETLLVVKPSSKLAIKGKTNVNRFNCYFDASYIKNPIPVNYKTSESNLFFYNTKLVLQNSCFDCKHRGINEDFYDLLNSNQYPTIILELLSVKKQSEQELHIASVMIELAGVNRPYEIPVTVEKDELIAVKGSIKLNICDFNLDPPTKALGLIVVDEEVEINLELELKELAEH